MGIVLLTAHPGDLTLHIVMSDGVAVVRLTLGEGAWFLSGPQSASSSELRASDSCESLKLNCLSSQQIGYRRMQGDACRCDHTDNVGDLGSCGIVSIKRERPRVVLLVGAQGDLLEDASRTGRVSDTRRSVGSVVANQAK
jgi:hypothetical protein